MRKLFNLRPMLFIAVSLCCGIAVTYFFIREKFVWGVIFSVAFLVFLMLFFFAFTDKKRKKVNAIFALVFALFFFIGGARLYNQINAYQNANLNNHYYEINGKVYYSEETDYGTNVRLKNVSVKGNVSGKLKYNVTVYVYGNTDVDIGDELSFSAYLKDTDFIYEDKFNAYSVESGIKYSAEVHSSNITFGTKSLSVFERVNLFIRDSLKSGLDEEEFAVGYAMLIGNSDYIEQSTLSAYRTAGVAHVFAVSGLHIGFPATALTFLMKKLRFNNVLRVVLTVAITVFYSGVCGFSASSIRATVMTAVMLVASLGGERYDGLTATSIAATGILCVSPIELLCVGFQLSFAVVLGIMLLSRSISKLFKFLPKVVGNSLGAVLSAQLSAIPIMLNAFGYFSWISIIANLVFIPLVSVIFIATLLLATIGGVFSISSITLAPIGFVLKIINTCITVFDKDVFLIGGIVLGGGTLSYYAALIVVSGLINLRKLTKIITAVTLAVICVATSTVLTVSEINSTKIYVSGSEYLSATLISDKSQSVLIVSDTEYFYSTSRLKRIASDIASDQLDALIFMGGYGVDMQVFISRLYTVFRVKTIYYYGKRDLQMEAILKKSMKGIETFNVFNGEEILLEVFPCEFALDGNVLVGKVKGKKMAVFSSFKKGSININNLEGEYDIAVCADGADAILAKINAPLSISYRTSSAFPDAESSGNKLIKLT